MAYTEKQKRILHRMGYYDYQHGLIHRHLNQEQGWNSHLENCRSYIIRAVQAIRPEKVTVLGSGWLLDLPLAEILETAGRVTLIDIVHPPEASGQVSALAGVTLTEDDATGGLVTEVWEKAGKGLFRKKLHSLNEIQVPEYQLKDEPGLVISLNILSQLDVLPVRFLRKKSDAGEKEIESFRRRVQESHLRFLRKQRSVLITDFKEIFTDSEGTTTEERSVLADLPEGSDRQEWTWDFDLKRSDFYGKSSVLKVIAMTLP